MNCRDFELVVAELARGDLMVAPEGREALAHSEICPGCAERLEQERSLTAAFHALAESESSEAPARVEVALRDDFRSRRRGVRSMRWAAPAAAVAAVMVAFAWTARPPKKVSTPVAKQVIAAPLPLEAPPKATPVVAKKSNRQAKRTVARAAAASEATTPFIPLETPAPVTGSSQLVRIRMQRAALRTFGFPINEERAAERISADVLLGEDGTALAIRLVR